jgi:hypothetical protein
MTRYVRTRIQTAAPQQFKDAFEVTTIASFEEFIDPKLREAVAVLDSSKVQELTDLATETLLHQRSPQAFLRQIGELVGENYLEAVVRNLDETTEIYGVPFLLRGDLGGFTNALLDERYRNSLLLRDARAVKAGKQIDTLNALEWAIRTRSKTARAELARLFGKDYRSVLRSLKSRRVVTRLTEAEIAKFDELVQLGVTDYITLSRANTGFGHLYEIDHLLEQRFWRNNPNVVSALDERGHSFAYVVPKNPRIAALLQAGVPDSVPHIRYVHTVKTKALRDLIPYGSEHLYSIQQIWDAHIVTFDALGFERREYIRRLEDMFKEYVDGLRLSGIVEQGGKAVEYPVIITYPTVADFFP